MNTEELRRTNIDFMIGATYKIGFDNEFKNTLLRASREFGTELYHGLQELKPTLGYIFVDTISADGLLQNINTNNCLLQDFMEKVHEMKNEYFPRDDNSIVEIPFEGKSYEDFSIFLEIVRYTKGYDDFAPVKNPLEIPSGNHLERIAHMGLKFFPQDNKKDYLEKQQDRINNIQKKYLAQKF